jgi:hypothetical protein
MFTSAVSVGENIRMKKIVSLAIVAVFATFMVIGQANAASTTYTVTAGTGTYDLLTSNNGLDFTFQGTGIDIQNVGTTSVSITNGTLDGAGDITGGDVTFGNTSIPGFTLDQDSEVIHHNTVKGIWSSEIVLGSANGDTLILDGANPVNPTATSFNGTISGGSYTSPAPEAGSAVAFGAMLAAGGLLLFAAKRRSSSTIA